MAETIAPPRLIPIESVDEHVVGLQRRLLGQLADPNARRLGLPSLVGHPYNPYLYEYVGPTKGMSNGGVFDRPQVMSPRRMMPEFSDNLLPLLYSRYHGAALRILNALRSGASIALPFLVDSEAYYKDLEDTYVKYSSKAAPDVRDRWANWFVGMHNLGTEYFPKDKKLRAA